VRYGEVVHNRCTNNLPITWTTDFNTSSYATDCIFIQPCIKVHGGGPTKGGLSGRFWRVRTSAMQEGLGAVLSAHERSTHGECLRAPERLENAGYARRRGMLRV
jgi:hypothetical protein